MFSNSLNNSLPFVPSRRPNTRRFPISVDCSLSRISTLEVAVVCISVHVSSWNLVSDSLLTDHSILFWSQIDNCVIVLFVILHCGVFYIFWRLYITLMQWDSHVSFIIVVVEQVHLAVVFLEVDLQLLVREVIGVEGCVLDYQIDLFIMLRIGFFAHFNVWVALGFADVALLGGSQGWLLLRPASFLLVILRVILEVHVVLAGFCLKVFNRLFARLLLLALWGFSVCVFVQSELNTSAITNIVLVEVLIVRPKRVRSTIHSLIHIHFNISVVVFFIIVTDCSAVPLGFGLGPRIFTIIFLSLFIENLLKAVSWFLVDRQWLLDCLFEHLRLIVDLHGGVWSTSGGLLLGGLWKLDHTGALGLLEILKGLLITFNLEAKSILWCGTFLVTQALWGSNVHHAVSHVWGHRGVAVLSQLFLKLVSEWFGLDRQLIILAIVNLWAQVNLLNVRPELVLAPVILPFESFNYEIEPHFVRDVAFVVVGDQLADPSLEELRHLTVFMQEKANGIKKSLAFDLAKGLREDRLGNRLNRLTLWWTVALDDHFLWVIRHDEIPEVDSHALMPLCLLGRTRASINCASSTIMSVVSNLLNLRHYYSLPKTVFQWVWLPRRDLFNFDFATSEQTSSSMCLESLSNDLPSGIELIEDLLFLFVDLDG